jgi:hypothetical protein
MADSRPGGELTRQLHRAVPRPPHPHPPQREDRHHFCSHRVTAIIVKERLGF